MLISQMKDGGTLASKNPNFDLSFQTRMKENFSKVEWPGANLRRAILDGCDFRESNLEGADLTGASVRDADFMKAALDRACLQNIDARRAKFGLANMQGADVKGADLRGIRGKYAVWRGVNWWEARLSDQLHKSLKKKWPRAEAEAWRMKNLNEDVKEIIEVTGFDDDEE
ncbi:MAG TPA: pentapeptide repeat-containing protein [Candidatus Poseidoniales archaeon]|nr:pentapeptide repeat-containing protein [Candidatus Poseidoniales archaeon]